MQFTTFPVFCHQSISFHPKSQKSAFLGGEGTLANFLSFSTFWIPFTTNGLKMTHNGEFCQKSQLDWLKMANFSHFVGFPHNSLSFSTFLIPFTPNWLKLTHHAKFCQKWVRLAQNGSSLRYLHFYKFRL